MMNKELIKKLNDIAAEDFDKAQAIFLFRN